MKKQIGIIRIIEAAAIMGLLVLAAAVLKEDSIWLYKWWLAVLLLGIGVFPVTVRLFGRFRDRGWIFSKAFGILLCGFCMWVASEAHFLKFTGGGTLLLAFLTCAVLWGIFAKGTWAGCRRASIELILAEEALFLLFFLLWLYLSGCKPEAHGTEKYMDYGFMASMMRSDYLPAPDIWYGGRAMNYYYGGQYYAVWLTKLTFSRVEEGYHLMRALVGAFAFAFPFSMGWQLMYHKRKKAKIGTLWAAIAGVLAAMAVSLAGNMHYVIYGKLRPLFNRLFGTAFDTSYWFPNSTRYIGYNPDTNDKTIHEFPSYSLVLGDLHAHMVNLIGVLAVLALVYAWLKNARAKGEAKQSSFGRAFIGENLIQPELWVLSFLLGLFQWTNFWDYVIYFVVIGAGIVVTRLYRYPKSTKAVLLGTLLQAGLLLLLSNVTALPFTAGFETMVSGVALAQQHTRFYQLLVLWGLPILTVLVFLAVVLLGACKKRGEKQSFAQLIQRIPESDLVALIFGLCGVGLVLIPELVYVRDIYEAGYARSNTMFKLTYQAFVLFGISMSYMLLRLLLVEKNRILRGAAAFGLLCLLATCGYFPTAVQSWFGEVWQREAYKGLDATAFLEEKYPEDAGAIRFLQQEVKGSPVVLEANGDSYSEYCRVSAMTGLPTVLGWYVHEWLWRGNPEDLNQRSQDIGNIYTGEDEQEVRRLLQQYEVEYLFLGSMEREKYPQLDEEFLKGLGSVCYEDDNTCIIKTDVS